MDVQNYENQIEQKVSQFRKQVDKIENSENPYYHDKAVQQYEIKKLRETLETEVAEINAEYQQKADQAVEQAKETAAKSYFPISETDRKLVQNILDDFTADVTLAYNDDQRNDAFSKMEAKLEYLSENQLAAVRKQLPEVLSKASDKKTASNLRKLNTTLAELQTPEEKALADAQATAETAPDAAYKRLRITHPAFSDVKENRSGGSQL